VHGAALSVPGSVSDIFAACFRSNAFNLSTAARLSTGGDKTAILVLGIVLNDLAACFRSSAFDHGAFFLADSFSTRELGASIVELSIILSLGAARLGHLLSASNNLALFLTYLLSARELRAAKVVHSLIRNVLAPSSRSNAFDLRTDGLRHKSEAHLFEFGSAISRFLDNAARDVLVVFNFRNDN